VFLDAAQRKAVIAAASPADARFLRKLELTGARPNEQHEALAVRPPFARNGHRFFGRRAVSIADYSCSAARKTSGLRWDRSTLDRRLVQPEPACSRDHKRYLKIDDGVADLVHSYHL